MEKINKARELIESIKNEISLLSEKIDQLNSMDLNTTFISPDLCNSTAMSLQTISAYQESLIENIGDYADSELLGIADAELVIGKMEIIEQKRLLLKKFSSVRTSNPKYDELLQKLALNASENDENSTERFIAEMLVSDLINNTSEIVKNEQVENSEYYKLAFAFNRKELYITTPETDNESEPDGDHESAPTSSDEQPPPAPDVSSDTASPAEPDTDNIAVSSQYEQGSETILDIDLSRPEDFADSSSEFDNYSDQTYEGLTLSKLDESSDIEDIIKNNRDIFEENPDELVLNIDRSDDADKKISISEALNLLAPKRGKQRSANIFYWTILTELLRHGPQPHETLSELSDILSKAIGSINMDIHIEKLYSKGVLSKIHFDSSLLYYFTEKGLKINHNDKIISNFYCFSSLRSKPVFDKRECKTIFPVTSFSLCSAVMMSRFAKKFDHDDVIGHSDNSVEGLSSRIFESDEKKNCCLAFVTDNSLKLGELYEFLKTHSEAFELPDKFVIGSYTPKQAAVVLDVVKSALGSTLDNTKFILYSYKNDEYYDPDLTKYTDSDAENDDIENDSFDESEAIDSDDEDIIDTSADDEEDDIIVDDLDDDIDDPADNDASGEDFFNGDSVMPYDDPDDSEDLFDGTFDVVIDDLDDDFLNDDKENILEKNENKNEFSFTKVNRNYNFTKDEVETVTAQMILSGKAYCALSYLKVVSEYNSDFETFYKLVSYAYDNPIEKLRYSSENLLALATDISFDGFSKFLFCAAALRNLFYNDSQFDHNINSITALLTDDELTEIGGLAEDFGSFKKKYHKGIDIFSDYKRKEQLSTEERIKTVCRTAREHYNTYVLTPFVDNSVKRYELTVRDIFNKDEYLAAALSFVKDDQRDQIDFVTDFVKDFLKSGSEIREENIRNKFIDNLINEVWERNATHKRRYHTSDLMSDKRRNLFNKILNSLRDMINWIILINESSPTQNLLSETNKKELILKINSASAAYAGKSHDSKVIAAASYRCICDVLHNLRSRLDGSFNNYLSRNYFFIDFLKPENILIPLDEDTLLPVLNDYCPNVEQLGIINRLREHSKLDISDSFGCSFKGESQCDLSLLRIICRYLTDKGEPSPELEETLSYLSSHLNNITARFEKNNENFIGDLELFQSFGKFETFESTDYKETIIDQTQDIYKYSKNSQNYGFYVRATETVKNKIEQDALIQGERIKKLLEEVVAVKNNRDPDSETQKEIDSAIEKINGYIDIQNYTAAEDLINRIKNNDMNESLSESYSDALNDFIYEYSGVYRLCSGGNVSFKSNSENSNIKRYLQTRNKAPKDFRGGAALLDSWPMSSPDERKITTLLSLLGLNCKVTKIYKDYFDCVLTKSESDSSYNAAVNYPHIFAPFGSFAHKSSHSFRVACFFGDNQSARLIKEIDNLSKQEKDTILLVNHAYQLEDRKKLAQLIRRRHYPHIYMPVDKVAITYIAGHYESTTGQATAVLSKLMNICMPFSYYQPYVIESSGEMPPEIFIGRVDELNAIKSPNGVQLLYGGRQLGKSALLKKAKEDINSKRGQKAVYVDVRKLGVPDAAVRVSRELFLKGVLDRDSVTDSWSALADSLKVAIHDQDISYLLLLIDEGDIFIKDCANYDYRPLENLEYVMNDGRFKFVIAGLHNILRFYNLSTGQNNKSHGQNSVIPHFKSAEVKPFKYREARKLLEYPLASIGVFFDENSQETQGLISTILATANYFPSLIQFYCSKLVEKLRDTFDNNVPPFKITKEQIRDILNDSNFKEEIKDKFQITLYDEEDNYYEAIALLVTFILHENGFTNGVTPLQVYEYAKDFSIGVISSIEPDKIRVLMEELVVLNIFRKSGEHGYIFSRQNFLQLMGSSEEVIDKLEKYAVTED